MDRIARATEPDLPYGEWLFSRTDQATQDIADSVAQSAVGGGLPAGPRGSGGADHQRAHRRGSSPPTGPGCRCWRSRRRSRRSAPQPALRRQCGPQPRDRDPRRCSRMRAVSPRESGVPNRAI